MKNLLDAPSGGLVVTRHTGEELVIEHAGRIVAVVQVTSLRHDRAQLRIRAPADVLVDRAEVYHRRRNGAGGAA